MIPYPISIEFLAKFNRRTYSFQIIKNYNLPQTKMCDRHEQVEKRIVEKEQ